MTRRIVRHSILLATFWLAAPIPSAAGAASPAPFKEILELVRKELPGVTDAELDRLAGQGLIAQLGSRAFIVSDSDASELAPCVLSSNLFDNDFAYVRVGRVGTGLAAEFQRTLSNLSEKSKPKGLVVDLRFANGHDYASAAAVVDLFVGKAQPLFKVGDGEFRSHEKASPITLPTAILVNSQTAVAAEALGAALRDVNAGILVGDVTAGKARAWRTFTLSDGTRLALAGDAVRLGAGNAIPTTGVTPDILVKVKPEEERQFLADPYLESAVVSDPARAAARRRMNEAQLVRERNGAGATNEIPALEKPDEPGLVVRDPALARSLDLLKGLAVVRRPRPS